ncbi:MAG: tRNA pseudouridine(55) synthase TruB [Acuticoccus sp.]
MVKTFDLSHDGAKPAFRSKQKGGNKRRGKPKNALDGWIVLDKPVGLTSTQALAAVKRLFWPDKAGHAGTLDPLASGLLPLAFGEATKTVPFVVDGAKRYRFTITWGAATDSDDSDGKTIATSDVRPSRAEIEAALPRFIGAVTQVPPRYSAVKIDGQRAYDLAREGVEVELKARTVTIDRLAIIGEPTADTVTLEADCGKGTYVRSIARDLAEVLGTCGHVSALRRTRVGPFAEADMVTLETLRAIAEPQEAIDTYLRSPSAALEGLATVEVDRVAAGRLRRGQSALMRTLLAFGEDEDIGALCGGELIALCRLEEGALQPARVFRTPRRRITVTPKPPADDAASGDGKRPVPGSAPEALAEQTPQTAPADEA